MGNGGYESGFHPLYLANFGDVVENCHCRGRFVASGRHVGDLCLIYATIARACDFPGGFFGTGQAGLEQ